MTNPAHFNELIQPLIFRLETSNKHGVSCSVSLLRRVGYQMDTLDVSDLGEDDSCTHYLGDRTNANSLLALVLVETRRSVYTNWAMDPLSLEVEEEPVETTLCPFLLNYLVARMMSAGRQV